MAISFYQLHSGKLQAKVRFIIGSFISTFILLGYTLTMHAQNLLPVQQVRGVVSDQVLQQPVEGATVTLASMRLSVVTDKQGSFRFSQVPVGVHQLQVTHIGFRETILYNVVVNSGKETVLTINMEQIVKTTDTVVIRAGSRKNKPLNEMSTVSARAFTVEETQRYAAAVNDPSRMAMAFPGVLAADDGNNDIIIRGNSPTGLLWRMEGVDIPNPNHFASTGSSGGGISILSAQLLANSDFVTGAFASEYGNALSGVFDLRLRKGNNEKREFTLQAGLLGLNAAAEGPLMPFYKGSFLVNYRYSTLQVLKGLGIPLETGSVNFQDLSYNIYLPTKKMGDFTLFGFGGRSDDNTKAVLDSTKWESDEDRYASAYKSNTSVAGISHNVFMGNNTNIRSAIAWSNHTLIDDYRYIRNDYTLQDEYYERYKTTKLTATSTINHRFSPKSTLRAGAIINFLQFDYYQRARNGENGPLVETINTKDKTRTLQGFVQWQYKPFNGWTINAGLHSLKLFYNNSAVGEPRASLKWQPDNRNHFAFGFGRHSQLQPTGVYFAEQTDVSGNITHPNKNLEFTKANHYVLSYQRTLATNLNFKTELYYQHLFDVPVSMQDSSTFSLLNVESEYVTIPLQNNGTGRNYGIELSLERYLRDNYYYTFSTSLYQSKYKAADGIERNTRFNGNYIFNLVTGKDFVSSDKLKTFGIHIKTLYAGGLRTTPLDVERSNLEGRPVYNNEAAWEAQTPAYFRTDLRLAMKWNRKHVTSTLSLDIQNVTNGLNVSYQAYDADKKTVVDIYQNGLIPILNYKIEF